MSSLALAPEPDPQPDPRRDPPAPLPREPFFSGPLAGILTGNAITFAGAVFQHWPALPVLIIYWGQSVIIGIANVIRMLELRDFSTDGFTSNGRQIPATRAGQVSTARFFAFHYGAFHAAYALFLFRGGLGHLPEGMGSMIAANIALFAGSHIWHVLRSSGQDFRRKPNLGTLMFYPYLRILPMHLAIILGSAFPLGALPFFILLKTGADLGMHEVERRMFQPATG
jgi:1,4-dihydroxy-2-naphthoate octaprenyltransferase